jgi:hydroxymethylbilane synthase
MIRSKNVQQLDKWSIGGRYPSKQMPTPMDERDLILGTRGSALALAQATMVRAQLHRAFPQLNIELKILKTSGDKNLGTSLSQSGTVGFFTKELEEALLKGKIDIAVHSLKDLPTKIADGLMVAAVTEREDPSDVLIFKDSTNPDSPKRVFTSSPRRSVQAQMIWPQCEILAIRGNVETRLNKMVEGQPGDALLLASAGLRRLNYLQGREEKGKLNYEGALNFLKLPFSKMIPAPGQGAIGIEVRADDGVTQERVRPANHPATASAVTAERAFLKTLGGGCAEPIAAFATIEKQGMRLCGLVARDGSIWQGELCGETHEAETMGKALALRYQQEHETR